MKNKKIIEKNGKKIRIRPVQIHTRKLDRIAEKYAMRNSGLHKICKPDMPGAFRYTWRDYVPE